MKKYNKIEFKIMYVVLATLLFGCNISDLNNSGSSKITISAPETSRSISSDIVSYSLTVTGDDFTDITENFTGGTLQIDVKKGSNRVFYLYALDSIGDIIFFDRVATDVTSNTAIIEMELSSGYYLESYYFLEVDSNYDGDDGPNSEDLFYLTFIDDIASLTYYTVTDSGPSEMYRGNGYSSYMKGDTIFYSFPETDIAGDILIEMDSTESLGDYIFKYGFEADEVTGEETFYSFTGSFTANSNKSSLGLITDLSFDQFYDDDELNFDGTVYELTNTSDIIDITSLTPNFTVSLGATVSPASGVTQDFDNPVEYTVTAEDGSETVYTLTLIDDYSGGQ